MKFTQILVLLLILVIGVSFAGCVGSNDDKQPSGAEDTPSSADAKDNPILGVWDGYERGGNMQLVFYENGTVSVNFRDQPALLKTWTLEGKTYRIYDADGYNSANVTFQNDNTIQYATSGAVLYSLSRNTAQAGNIAGTWEGYDRNGKMQLIFSNDGKVIVNYRDAPGLTKTWKQEGSTYLIYDDDGYNSAKAVFQNENTLQYTTSGALLYTLTRVGSTGDGAGSENQK